ncbi:ABC transporter transmembrane domain-containing protein [Reinekea marina]|uniref:ABC transporter transmembrane domain-containing protein n=1 Tax=Reinekea marina TaxID=1310421 RepID=A0ABV7WUH0_9GAMM|nr:ABC transporter transmembrane domain-containing protein [Reinekea marina]MDN3648227.1 ABC transporter transmembrane domain-containing protein [Reinekea marina]
MSVFLKLTWFFRQEWRRYSLAVIALIGVGGATMIPPWVIGKIVDAIADGSLTKTSLQQQVFIILGAALFSYGLRVLWRIALFGASYTLANQLRQTIFAHLTLQAPEFFDRLKTGDLMARATNDIQAVEMTAGEAVLALFDGAFTGLLVLIMMTVFISWPLTIIALGPWPIVGFFMWRYGKQLHQSFKDAQARFSDLNDSVQESISALRLTRAMGRETIECEQFNNIAASANEANQRVAKIDSKYDPTIQLGIGFSFFLSIAGGAYFIHQGELTLGQLTSFTLYLGFMIWPMFAIGWLLNLVERGSAAYERIDQLLNSQPTIKDNGTQNQSIEPSLTFEIEQFSYPESQASVLKDIEFQVPSGSLVGIVGPVGAGKSTLLHLLMRMQQVPMSAITLGGVDINDLTLNNLRRHIAVVPQTPFLFSMTIAQNIALAKPSATMQEIESVAKIAQVHEDILGFPQGYLTEVGERGVTLSGGQKQRLAIARALILDAPVLVLDDALSAVDIKTEQQILSHLKQARQGKTTLVVCHRLSAVEQANHVIVMESGRIIEQGQHRELIQQQGWYAKTYDYQQLEHVVEEGR